MKSLDIRKKFFDFFIRNGHEKIESSSLIPAQDPTLLFANAGMNQFKDVFLAKETRSYKRAVTIQKCMRAGGKHNDLDNVGFTKRHLTFFEMMGNFSFGDYFKKEAIEFAWSFITKELKIDQDKLHVTVFESDDESYDLWLKNIGVLKERVHRLGASDNFWQMGDIGPCGPCTEIYIDRGEGTGCGSKNCFPGCSCDRFLEFWNLVFMQYNKQPNGDLEKLKQTGVDTGMGLERICAIMQNVDSVYQIDLFLPIIKKIENLSGLKYNEQEERIKAAFHVLADHIRASSFLIADGCSPSNEGRGYVLRKIIRRAALFEKKLTEKSIFPQLSESVVESMSDIYPELKINARLIKDVLESEVEKFATNLIRGTSILEKYFEENKFSKTINGEQAFKLYDTYGFPIEIVHILSNEKGFTVDVSAFELEMQKQKERSGKKVINQELNLDDSIITEFIGYTDISNSSEVQAIIHDNVVTNVLKNGQEGWIITKKTPFFVETGGQVSDKGYIKIGNQVLDILDLKKINKAVGIKIKASNDIKVGDRVFSEVDKSTRLNTMKNHTATHLLQSALIKIFGKQIKQSGSVVNPDYLRFDFTFGRNLTNDEIKQIEEIVNEKIMENIPVTIYQTTYKDALQKGVIAIFGEKYNPENVRVIDILPFSAELCGGTHVNRTGDIGCFKIVEVGALSAGSRRIVAVTGPKAIELFQADFNVVKTLGQEFKVKTDEVLESVLKQKTQLKNLQDINSKLKTQLWKLQIPKWLETLENIKEIPFLFLDINDFNVSDLKDIVLSLQQNKPGFYFVISNVDGKSVFVTSLAKQYTNKINLKDFSSWLAKENNLVGGGSDTQIQGGGPLVNASLQSKIKKWLESV